ncbi:deacetylase Oant_2987-like [Littorina saxatilis]|uniref:Amidohydrolase-related domain-containing protein n=1 Tax=Littorina saxatilis TaxID=31220 RepID=A0AAN9AVE3_9CAEN
MADLVITGARIIDPANGLDTSADLYIQDGRIVHIGNGGGFPPGGAEVGRIIDAKECVVTPGLIDFHVHAYEHVTPLGINLDGRCLSRGVTTAVDAGSAGCSTLNGLRKFIKDQSKCRLYAFLHIASHGLASAALAGLKDGGEIDSLNQVDVDGCVTSVRDNRDFVVGIKLRISVAISDNGRNEPEAYRRALQAAGEAGVPLMVHHSFSTVPTVRTPGVLSCPGDLRAGDIFTHAFHWHKGCLLDKETGRVYHDVWEAKRRGVLFDIGHGFGSFAWLEAEACTKEGFWPDIISTDLHTASVDGPAYDLTTVMSKMLHLGMPLNDVIAAVTSKPAAAIGKSQEIGSLKIGNEADITILRLDKCSIELEDTRGETRTITERIVPVRVFRSGVEYPIQEIVPWPNSASKEKCQKACKQYAAYAQSKQSL